MNFYEEIKRLSRIKGFTLDSLMKYIGKPGITTFSGWKHRDCYPRADELFKICQALGVSMEHFFDEEQGIVVQKDMMQLVNKLNNIPLEEIRILNNLTIDQFRNLIQLAKSMQP